MAGTEVGGVGRTQIMEVLADQSRELGAYSQHIGKLLTMQGTDALIYMKKYH